MSREIRRVPPNWKHPKDHKGRYKPLFDEDYATALADWQRQADQWENGTHPDLVKSPELQEKYAFPEWCGEAPDPDYYRPAWTEAEATAYQVYETVSEGTPDSPVFDSEADLRQWLLDQGHSEKATDAFMEYKWAPSAIMAISTEGQMQYSSNIDSWNLK
ncbi:MAG TPA: hypothetical protein VM537_01260 [Anaerolineae bacterium]|nr:hypothetical protein [Anaerolineae bacterium]HUX77032.1 hypothetical protein [Anaerolineae bacterium]